MVAGVQGRSPNPSCEDSKLSAAVTTRQVQELSGQMSVKERRVR